MHRALLLPSHAQQVRDLTLINNTPILPRRELQPRAPLIGITVTAILLSLCDGLCATLLISLDASLLSLSGFELPLSLCSLKTEQNGLQRKKIHLSVFTFCHTQMPPLSLCGEFQFAMRLFLLACVLLQSPLLQTPSLSEQPLFILFYFSIFDIFSQYFSIPS